MLKASNVYSIKKRGLFDSDAVEDIFIDFPINVVLEHWRMPVRRPALPGLILTFRILCVLWIKCI